MKYYVRTTGERVLDSSYNQIKYELLVDKEHKPNESFIEQLIMISGDDDVVLLEDDLKLCKDFKKKIEAEIAKHPNNVINFFSRPEDYYTSHFSDDFLYNQCTYYPKGIGKTIGLEMKRIYNIYSKNGYDIIEKAAMKKLNMIHYIVRPVLVQHIGGRKSLIDRRIKYDRDCIYFEDYLNELGITIEEAYEKENHHKLTQLLIKDRNTWR